MHALFVFAHQDDEVAAAARIRHLMRDGATITCVFLTNGEGGRCASSIRDEESRLVFAHLGVDLARVHFAGSEACIPDGQLVRHLDRALELLEERVPERVDEVWCLAWEGGHQDHDASHLVAVAFAKRRGLLDRCYELPLYQGYLRALAPLRGGAPWDERRISIREGMAVLALSRFYRSQRRTWLALLPPASLRLLLGRREWSRAVDVKRLTAKPHGGRLFYERRFRFPWDEFQRHARDFIARASGPLPSDRDRPRRAGSR